MRVVVILKVRHGIICHGARRQTRTSSIGGLEIICRILRSSTDNLASEWSEPRLAKDIVQVHNPRTDRYVKIDRDAGRILAEKKSPGPYKNIPVARKPKDS